jgi:prepilin-type N-terminal cleavage/methylation domain-containing protein/prepilin-type processing-associated H-X9-DG protein
MSKRLPGLTLIEVIVVTVVVAILLVLLLPALARSREESRQKACKENCSQIGKAIIAYTMDGAFWPFAWGPANSACSKAPGGANTDMCDPGSCLGRLYPQYVTPKAFRCPSTEDQPSFVLNTPQGALTLYVWSTRTFMLKSNQPLAPGSAVTRACSYGYDPRIYPSAVSNMVMLADWDGTGMIGSNSSSQNHAGGQNVLYVDGSVRWQVTNFCSNDPMDDIFTEGGIGKNGAAVCWNADTDVYLVNAPTTLGLSYNEYSQLQQ